MLSRAFSRVACHQLRFRQVLWQRHRHHPSFWLLHYKIVLLGSQLSIFIGLPTCRPPLLSRIHDRGTGASSRIVPPGEHSLLKYEDTRGSGYWTQKSNFAGFPSRECGVNLYRVLSTMAMGCEWHVDVTTCDINMPLYRGIKPLA
jgi:hypothetical protein